MAHEDGEHAHAHAHGDAHDHHHGPVAYDRAIVDDAVLKDLDAVLPPLGEHLSLVARYGDLSQEERGDAVRLHEELETNGPFVLGFHADGDHCAVCEEPTVALFEDAFKNDVKTPWAAFLADLPVHVACVPRFEEKFPRLAPRVLDQAKRRLSGDLTRPPANIAMFWRHDVVRHGALDLEDWVNAVLAENEEARDKRLVKAIDRLHHYVHGKLFHAR